MSTYSDSSGWVAICARPNVPVGAVVQRINRRRIVPPGHVQITVSDGLGERDRHLSRVAVGPHHVVAHAAGGHLSGLGPPVHEQGRCCVDPTRFVSCYRKIINEEGFIRPKQ